MNIAGLQKLSLTDYPGKVACIIFTQGCSMKCPYCQNSELIPFESKEKLISEDAVLEFIEKRHNSLDGVVITGGQPLLHNDIDLFLEKIKKYNLSIKIDTNGTGSEILKRLIDKKLVDYIAMDVKSDFTNFNEVIGVNNFNTDQILDSINLIKNSNIEHEFRTTLVKEYHNLETIRNICKLIGNDSNYYLQNFEDSENVLDHSLNGFTKEELLEIKNELIKEYPMINLRGI